MLGHHTTGMADDRRARGATGRPSTRVYRSRPPRSARARCSGEDAGLERAARARAPRRAPGRDRRGCAAGDGRRRGAPHHPRARRALARARASAPGSRSRSSLFLRQRADPAGQGLRRGEGGARAAPATRSTSPNTILVLGSDARREGSKEPGAQTGRPEPLGHDHAVRVGGGTSRAPVDPARHGRRHPRPRPQKINAAYAFGGAALAIQTIEQYLGIADQPRDRGRLRELPEAGRRAGRRRRTTRLRRARRSTAASRTAASRCACARGEHHLDGKQALALARTRKNDCNPSRGRPHPRATPAADPRPR